MLGNEWESIHAKCLHRLGNLTLTAYNSEYSNRSFEDKKKIKGGFNQSAVRLNEYVKNQNIWTEAQIEERGRMLAKHGLKIWPYHGVDEKQINEKLTEDLRRKSALQNLDNLEINKTVRILMNKILESVSNTAKFIRVIEKKSVCLYRSPGLFAELLPLTNHLRIMLPIDYHSTVIPASLSVHDSSSWKYVKFRVHNECNTLVDIWSDEHIALVLPMIRESYDQV